MAAKILDRVSEIFQTPRPKVPGWTYDLLERLVCHTPTLLVILESKVCVQLVNLLANEHPRVNRSARNTLPYIAQMLDDTPAIASKVLDHVLALLKSSSPEIRRWACSQVGELARHESTLPTMLESKACVGLVSLLCDTHSDVVQSALYVLTDIAQKLEGAEAIVKAKVLDNVPESTESSCLEVREQTCILIGMLVHHKSILLTVLESKAFVRLLSLLHDEHPEVVWSATRALSQIAEKLEGAQAIEKAKVLDNVSELIESLCLSAPHRACTLIEAVVHHGSILLPVLESKAFAQLLSLLHNEDLEIVQRATKALFQIAEKLEGAQALVESKVLDDISGLLESSCWGVQYWACTLIEELVYHESILPAVLESKVSVRLFPLLHDKCSEVVQSATRALSQIAEKLEGAQAIVKAQVLDNVSELIESSCSSVRFWACILIDALVHHESILPAVLESKTCAQLVAFLLWEATTSTNPYLALCVLREISEWPVGAAALIDMPVKFGGFEELCQSSDYVIQRAARSVLDDLARARSKQQIL
ncbi:hypothetical protein MVEN_00772200 [Mycena venus]|uniref:non-specific serine/threonine protein kinase n=1 Tax=Mycena venus TaxID=2733690 RepID=A0A8H6YKM6_9AGAR|nr:hypothetical protein MVEN_00772200 [Mycena venus]